MKNMKHIEKRGIGKRIGVALAKSALKVTTLNVNTACMFIAHQPKLPEGSKKLRKF